MGYTESNELSISDEIVQRQLTHKRALEKELHQTKYSLEITQYDIRVFEMSFPSSETDRLTEEIRKLQNECKMLSEILDKAGVAVLGDLPSCVNALSVNNREQQSQLSSNNSSNNSITRSPNRPQLPAALRTVASPQRALQMPAFTSLQHLNLQQQQNSSLNTMSYNPNDFQTIHSNNDNIPSWICSVCTFQNHPLLNKCEQCEQPRNSSGTIQITAAQFAPRYENVYYQQQARTNPKTANARSFSFTNNPEIYNNEKQNTNLRVPQSAPICTVSPNFGTNTNRTRAISSLEELQFENFVQKDPLEHIYVNVSSMSVGNIPKTLENENKTEVPKTGFVKGHKYRPSM